MKTFIQWCYLSLLIVFTPVALIQDVSAQELNSNTAQSAFSEAELEQMLAPIALYPDSLLTHILIAATYPLEVVEASRLQSTNTLLPAEQLMEKAEGKEWDPSVIALLAFPNVLEKLSNDLTWTQKLGDAFLQDEARLLASIQSLRQQADEADSLSEMDNVSVTRVNNQIVIEPAQPEVIYVPYYDPRVVYGHWRWYRYPPVYWTPYPYYVRRPYGHFYWNTGVHIRFNFYFSAFHWSNHHIVVTHHHNSHHYRHRGRIVTSHGAQRWQHKPQHRRGVAYRSNHVKQRYNSHRPSMAHTKQVRKAERHQLSHAKASNNRLHKGSSLERNNSLDRNKSHQLNRKLGKSREQQFTNKLHNTPSHNQVKSHQRVKSYQRDVKSHQPAKSHQPQRSTQPKQSHQRDVRSHQPVKSHQPQRSSQPKQSHQRVKSHQPQRSIQPKQSHNSSRPSHSTANMSKSHKSGGHQQSGSRTKIRD
ncbi:conserved hypothetical protein [Shewanella sediminis HAW-EB3]|uniref:DUF3300 domain-containing protein n=1 Tax=Shewanella sediminis (strain HAW-EB3) TaxID=425104 RepID=A8FYC9_SHESH|nr:DUF3300 domain-containing protein [Shewanella sediminis]ABV37852.1 conserved hypothetical protein [Shewanella sediminis HAW-EB3]